MSAFYNSLDFMLSLEGNALKNHNALRKDLAQGLGFMVI